MMPQRLKRTLQGLRRLLRTGLSRLTQGQSTWTCNVRPTEVPRVVDPVRIGKLDTICRSGGHFRMARDSIRIIKILRNAP
jgi:hypothetical protein